MRILKLPQKAQFSYCLPPYGISHGPPANAMKSSDIVNQQPLLIHFQDKSSRTERLFDSGLLWTDRLMDNKMISQLDGQKLSMAHVKQTERLPRHPSRLTSAMSDPLPFACGFADCGS
jgi:hypothetical protein